MLNIVHLSGINNDILQKTILLAIYSYLLGNGMGGGFFFYITLFFDLITNRLSYEKLNQYSNFFLVFLKRYVKYFTINSSQFHYYI